MAISHVVSGLISKHAELAGEIEYHRNQIKRLRVDLMAIDTAIGLFDPDYSVNDIQPTQKKAKNKFFSHGEGSRLLMELLRDAGGPITTPEILNEACRRKNLVLEGQDKASFNSSLFVILKRLEKKNICRQVSKDKGVITWKLVA